MKAGKKLELPGFHFYASFNTPDIPTFIPLTTCLTRERLRNADFLY